MARKAIAHADDREGATPQSLIFEYDDTGIT